MTRVSSVDEAEHGAICEGHESMIEGPYRRHFQSN